MTTPQNPPQGVYLYQLQPPFNSSIANVSLGSLEADVRRSLHATKKFPDAQSVAVVAGSTGTMVEHLHRALAHARRIDVTAGGLWQLFAIQTQVWQCADFTTRLYLNRAVFRWLRATFISRSAISSGATGEWFF